MTDDRSARLIHYEELLRRFASGVRATQLYAAGHPLLTRNVDGLFGVLQALHQTRQAVTVGIVDREFVVADTPMPKASAGMKELVERLETHGIQRISFERGVTTGEIAQLMAVVAALAGRSDTASGPSWSSVHIRMGRISVEEGRQDGIASDMAAIRRLYTTAVAAAETAWHSAAVDGQPDLPAALQVVEGLADAVTQNRTALVALTAMRNYDNYTFTHMVNVSILTMGQAQSLGIEGRLLRELGLSALMHDIGKVRTPQEILNKPGKLTDEELVIMRRHPVDGAEILRRTPEMPILAPVVAFEHHLRLDGSGYPQARRPTLNLGTKLCSIADVYDAMRSQRAYQQAFPSDRVLAVLRQNDGAHFDEHLVRRFVQLLGIYPPGTLVRLSSGEVAVVLRVHAPDPYRPRVKVLFDPAGVRRAVPYERSLWEANADEPRQSVVAPVEPSEFGIDPLDFLQAQVQ
ncbi:MAG TPA: HD-GYP domain-containing protein [Vicinamibacterales bacterium]|nr:HD-GYP domain-containing protein [Vicinamibacterales bacterium]